MNHYNSTTTLPARNYDRQPMTDDYFNAQTVQELSTFRMLNTRDNLQEKQKKISNMSNLEIKTKIHLDTLFYPLSKLKNLQFSNLYKILVKCNMIIFIDDKKLNCKKSGCFSRKLSISNDDFDGCTFFAYEYSKLLLNVILSYCNKISDAEVNNEEICQDNEVCSKIIFDENHIQKNTLYKKLEIQNKILFVPITKYNLKYTEYKLRGFCQIAEELGAKKILIKFEKSQSKSKEQSLNINLSTEQQLAGSLGFANKDSVNDSENRSYTLDYPAHNTINLNEEVLKQKIKLKKLIINETMFNSNLELQYLISARCRHFITKYSAVFTVDNNHNIDKSLISKFKSYGIDINLNYNSKITTNNFVSIITDVEFSDNDDNIENISGCSVNLDETGFNFLIQSLKEDNFETYGIFKIMDFINMYIEKTIIQYPQDYQIVKNIQFKIEENIIIDEYAKILCTYFNKNSQWLHLINFINLLRFKTKTYDKLGYLIIVNKIYDDDMNKLWTMVKFIQEYSTKNNIESKYWKMLQPFNKKIIFYLKDKLFNEFNFINNFNWFNFLNFIECLKSYNDIIDSEDNTIIFNKLLINMNIGFKYWEYYNNLIPFIKKNYYSLVYSNDLKHINTDYFEYYFNFESFNTFKINTIHKLEEFIQKKIKKIQLGQDFKVFLMNNIEPDIHYSNSCNVNTMSILLKIYDYFNRIDTKFHYFRKKLNEILEENNSENILLLFKDELKNISKLELIKNLIFKLIIYNEKINLKHLPLNELGFTKLYNNYVYGIKLYEFETKIIVFVKKLISYITNGRINKTTLTFDYFKSNINSYSDLLTFLQNNDKIYVPEYIFDEVY